MKKTIASILLVLMSLQCLALACFSGINLFSTTFTVSGRTSASFDGQTDNDLYFESEGYPVADLASSKVDSYTANAQSDSWLGKAGDLDNISAQPNAWAFQTSAFAENFTDDTGGTSSALSFGRANSYFSPKNKSLNLSFDLRTASGASSLALNDITTNNRLYSCNLTGPDQPGEMMIFSDSLTLDVFPEHVYRLNLSSQSLEQKFDTSGFAWTRAAISCVNPVIPAPAATILTTIGLALIPYLRFRKMSA